MDVTTAYQQWAERRRAYNEARYMLGLPARNQASLDARTQRLQDSTGALRAWEQRFCNENGWAAEQLIQQWKREVMLKREQRQRAQEEHDKEEHGGEEHGQEKHGQEGYDQQAHDQEGQGSGKQERQQPESREHEHDPHATQLCIIGWRQIWALLSMTLLMITSFIFRPAPVQSGFWQEATINATNAFQPDLRRAKQAIYGHALGVCALDHARSLLSPQLATPDLRLQRHRMSVRQHASGHCPNEDHALPSHFSSSASAITFLLLPRYPLSRLQNSLDLLETRLQDLSFLTQNHHGQVVAYLTFLLRGPRAGIPPPDCGIIPVACILHNFVRPTCIGSLLPSWTESEVQIQRALVAHAHGYDCLASIAGVETDLVTMTQKCLALTLRIWEEVRKSFNTGTADPVTANQVHDHLDFIFNHVLPNSCLGLQSTLTPSEYHLTPPGSPTFPNDMVSNDTVHLMHAFAAQIEALTERGMWTEDNILQLPSPSVALLAKDVRGSLLGIMDTFGNWQHVLLEERRMEHWTLMVGKSQEQARE